MPHFGMKRYVFSNQYMTDRKAYRLEISHVNDSLVAFIGLEGSGSRVVQIHSQYFNICIPIYIFPRRFQFHW